MPGRTLVDRALRWLTVLALLAFGIAILSISIAESGNAAQKDFISYWAAGQLLARHANPYDAAAVFALEKSAGFHEPEPLVMRNPPHALILALPLGLVSPAAGVVIWSLLIVAALMGSVRLLWILRGRSGDRTQLLIYIFAPALACVQLGQTSTFALLGLTLFLYLYRERPFAAGASLPLLLIKPHLLLPFGAVLLLWMWRRRAWRIAAGALAGAGLPLAAAISFYPSVVRDYLPVLRAANADSARIPTVSSLLGLSIYGALLGIVWAVVYFLRHRHEWDWPRHAAPILLVSLWLAPYAWFTDEILLAPAILQGIDRAGERRGTLWTLAALDAIALGLVIWGVSLASGALVWTSTAWLVWYLAASLRKQ